MVLGIGWFSENSLLLNVVCVLLWCVVLCVCVLRCLIVVCVVLLLVVLFVCSNVWLWVLMMIVVLVVLFVDKCVCSMLIGSVDRNMVCGNCVLYMVLVIWNMLCCCMGL